MDYCARSQWKIAQISSVSINILLHLENIFLKMKKFFSVIVVLLLLSASSCQTRVVSVQKPLQANSLDLYQKYTILTNDAKVYKVEVLKQTETAIYTKNKKGEEVVIDKSNIREVKKLDLLSSIAIGVAAIAAVIFVPI